MNKAAIYCKSFLTTVILLSLPVYFNSCGVYSFTGGVPDADNISIQEFYNNADLGPANMGQTFTNAIKNYFVQNTRLSVIPQDGQLQLEGEIMSYSLTPIAPTSTGDPTQITSASSTRLTITVKVTYVNTIDEEMSFKDKTFSFYKDFSNDQNLSDIEESYIKQIFDRIINDIFNASVANW